MLGRGLEGVHDILLRAYENEEGSTYVYKVWYRSDHRSDHKAHNSASISTRVHSLTKQSMNMQHANHGQTSISTCLKTARMRDRIL